MAVSLITKARPISTFCRRQHGRSHQQQLHQRNDATGVELRPMAITPSGSISLPRQQREKDRQLHGLDKHHELSARHEPSPSPARVALGPRPAPSAVLGPRRPRAQICRGVAEREYNWFPERSLSGPLLIIVSNSRPEGACISQRHPHRRSTCSTGKPGHKTPTGVFQILQKDKYHRSSTYNNAPMPKQ